MNYQTERVTFISRGKKLAGTLYKTKRRSKSPGILFLHGAGTSTSARFELWQQYLAENGYTSFIFDCAGVGKSEGTFEDGTLNNRLSDAEAALTTFISTNTIDEHHICVIGNSMSGHTAIRLTQKSKTIKALILAYAAAYSEEAEDKTFGPLFTKELRKENSWETSPVFPVLENFSGNVFVVYGENENVIPKGVQDTYHLLVKNKGKSIVITNAGHRMLLPTNDLEERAMQELFKHSKDFLDETFQ